MDNQELLTQIAKMMEEQTKPCKEFYYQRHPKKG